MARSSTSRWLGAALRVAKSGTLIRSRSSGASTASCALDKTSTLVLSV